MGVERTRILRWSAWAAVLAIAVPAVGSSGTLLLAGALLIGVALRRLPGRWDGPVVWAGAVAGTGLVVLGASAVLHLLSPHLHSQLVNLAVVGAPALAGGLLAAVRRHSPPGPAPVGPAAWVPVVSVGAAVASALAVQLSGPLHAVAWAMGGDARNHVNLIRTVLHEGGIGLESLTRYPVAVNAVAAHLSAAQGRRGTEADLLLSDVRATAAVYVLAGAALAVLLAGAVLETLRARPQGDRPERLGACVVALGAGALAGAPAVLGVALSDGFVSAYGSLPFAIAAVVAALHAAREPRHALAVLGLLVLVTPLTFTGWTLLAVVPAALQAALAGAVVGRLGAESGPTWVRRLGAGVAFGALAALAAVLVHFRAQLEMMFALPGAIRPVPAFAIPLLLAVTLALLAAAGPGALRRQAALATAPLVLGGLLVLWLKTLDPAGYGWTYYATKTSWLVAVCLAWIAFVPLAIGAEALADRGLTRPRLVVCGAAASVAVLGIVGSSTNAPEAAGAALRGWSQPSAGAVGAVLDGARSDEPFVLWSWSDPGNDRLANFWAALTWGATPDGTTLSLPGIDGGVAVWAYTEQDTTADLCTLARAAGGLDVLTRDRDLAGEIATQCPEAHAGVEVLP